ncbi:MAG TPA: hypothetical protein PK228_16015 [Saprospiraceae bacterium]|nr:hypothetical protein [Saprospiraceae bacterium]
MVTYQIQIPESQKDAFLNIIQSLQSVGMVKSFKPAVSLVTPGEPVSTDKLLAVLEESERQVKEGFSFSTDEATAFLTAWKSRKK